MDLSFIATCELSVSPEQSTVGFIVQVLLIWGSEKHLLS